MGRINMWIPAAGSAVAAEELYDVSNYGANL